MFNCFSSAIQFSHSVSPILVSHVYFICHFSEIIIMLSAYALLCSTEYVKFNMLSSICHVLILSICIVRLSFLDFKIVVICLIAFLSAINFLLLYSWFLFLVYHSFVILCIQNSNHKNFPISSCIYHLSNLELKIVIICLIFYTYHINYQIQIFNHSA